MLALPTAWTDRRRGGGGVDCRAMTAPNEPSDPTVAPSVAERLRRIHGAEVDPRVDLESSGRTEVRGSEPRRPQSSALLQRLGTRSVASSRYRLHGEIARGGMGAILEVFDEDLRRRLAMKVIVDRATGDHESSHDQVPPALLARFLEEAQVTGQLDHPGIVPVHELGLDARGQVYFTMRLVQGRDLEAIFGLVAQEREGWSTTRALGVLLKVCEAMAYAHQKGVVHRDLKPANVMVGRFGEVYVMDWGLARVRGHADRHDVRIRTDAPAPRVQTDRRVASEAPGDGALYTMDGEIVGTPSYMAPEQARGRVEAIDERTDVFAVGAMLYRLLAGAAPHTVRGETAAAAEVLARVLEGPPRPLEQLAGDAPAELVAICDKAMAPAPEQRYPDMLALAEDLRAFLEGRVVQAFERGALAEGRKWVRRNRALAAALAAAVVILALGLVVSVVFARRAASNAAEAEQRRTEAVASAAAARRQAQVAQEASSFLTDDLLAALAPEHEGIDVTVRQVLDQASVRLDGHFVGEPAVEASLRLTIGMSYLRLGEHETARRHLERALELHREHDGERAEPTVRVMRQVALVWSELGRGQDALALYEKLLPLTRAVLGPEHRGTATTMSDMALALEQVGRLDEARALLADALTLSTRVFGEDDPDTLASANNLALLDRRLGRSADAARQLAQVLERRRAISGERHPDTLNAMSNLAQALADLGRVDRALELSRAALELRRSVLGPEHPLTARELGCLGKFACQKGHNAEAEQHFREALRILRKAFGDEHQETLLAQHNLASALESLGQHEAALPLATATLAARRGKIGREHPDTLESMNLLAAIYRSLERLDQAETLYRETIALQGKVQGADHPLSLITRENLAGVLFAKRDYAASEAMVREVLAARRRVLGDEHPDVAKTTLNLGMVVKGRGDTKAALALFEEALQRSRAALGDGNIQIAECLRVIGDLRLETKNPEAAAAYREALAVRRQLGPDDETCGQLLHQLGLSLLEGGDGAGALAVFDEAFGLRQRLLGPDHVGTRGSLYRRAATLLVLGRHADAEPLALDYLTRTERAMGKDHEQAARGRKLLADLYTAWGRPEDAARWK